jgi:hypothetical protein
MEEDRPVILTEEEERFVIDLAAKIYANLMGAPDSIEKYREHNENVTGVEVFESAAGEALHRASWFILELRDWKADRKRDRKKS